MLDHIPGAVPHQAPEAPGQEQRLLDGILQNLAVGVAAVDSSGRQIMVNRALAEMTGYTQEELLGQRPPFKYWAEEDLPRITQAFQATLEGRPDTWEFVFQRKNGQRFQALVTVKALPVAGQSDIMMATVEDITARRQAEAESADRTRRLEALHLVSQAVSQSLDLKAVAALALEASLKVLGMEAGAIGYLDEATRELALLADRGLPPKMAQEIRDSPRLKFSQGAPGIVTQSGELLIIEDVAHDPRTVLSSTRESGFVFQVSLPLKFQGRVVGVLSAWSRHQQALCPEDVALMSSIGNIVGVAIANARLFRQVESAKRDWEVTFDAMSEGISIHAPDFRILRANQALARMLNTTPQALVGLPCYRVMHGQDEPIVGCPLLECLRTKAPTVVERQEPHLGNRWLQITCDPRFSRSGKVETVVHVVRDITRQKEQAAAERQRAQELEALTNIARILVQPGSFEERVTQALEELSKVSGAERVTLRLPDETGQNLRLVATNSLAAELPPPLLVPNNDKGNLSAVAFQQGQPIIVADYQNHPLAVPHGFAAGLTSAAFLPIRVGGQVRAVVSLASRQARLFTPERVRLLAAIADGIGALLENVRLQEAERLRSQELEARAQRRAVINRIARAISGSLDMNEIYATLSMELRRVVPFDRLSVALLTPEGDAITILQPGASPQMLERLKVEDSALREAAKTGKPRITQDLAEDTDYPTTAEHLQAGLRSRINVPLSAKGKLLGFLNLLSQEVGRYSETDLELLQPIADQLALALDNARLYQETVKSAEQRAAINHIARAIATSLDMEEIYATLAAELGQVISYDRLSIALLTPQGDALNILQPGESALQMPQRQELKNHVLEPIIRSGKPRVQRDLAPEAAILTSELLLRMGLRSVINLPLTAKGKVLGTLNLMSREVGRYSETDLELLQPIAGHLALALDNARLYQEISAELESNRRRLEAFQAAAHKLALEEDLDRALQHLADSARALVGASYGSLELWGPQGQRDKVFVSGLSPEALPQVGSGWSQMEQFSAKGVISTPITARGHTSGVLYVLGKEGAAEFSPDDQRLLDLVAVLAGVLLENIGLYGAVTRERQTLAAIQSSMTEGLVVLGGDGKVIYFNQAATAMTGWPGQEMLAQTEADVRRMTLALVESPASVASLARAVRDSAQGPVSVEMVLQRPQRRELKVTVFPIEVGAGERLTGLLLQDITQERDLERRRNAFVSVASHELRTPMTTIIGFAELLLRRETSEASRRQWLEHILRDSRRLASIVDDMLNVSRIQSGKVTVNAESLRLSEGAEDALRLVRPMTGKHQFQVDIPPHLPQVMADRDKLIQVLTNLLDNAVKYSPQGGHIAVSAYHQPERERVVVSVADEGVGIAPGDREQIFAGFYRVRRPETEGVRGTGLGLYIVRALVDLMGGQVWLESEPDKGSTFFFSLPAQREPEEGRQT